MWIDIPGSSLWASSEREGVDGWACVDDVRVWRWIVALAGTSCSVQFFAGSAPRHTLLFAGLEAIANPRLGQ